MTTPIQPGLLVALKSEIHGGVTYSRTDLDKTPDTSRWETTRIFSDPEEHERAVVARGKAVSAIRGVCCITSFGLLCPEAREEELDGAVEVAKGIAEDFNRDSVHTKINLFVIKGRIMSTDEQAARAITGELKNLLNDMNEGISKLDPAAIREAAAKAKSMAQMLSEDKSKAVQDAITEARAAARAIVKRVEKGGEAAAVVLQELDRSSINKARITFLDMEENGLDMTPAEAMPAVNTRRFAGLDDDDATETNGEETNGTPGEWNEESDAG